MNIDKLADEFVKNHPWVTRKDIPSNGSDVILFHFDPDENSDLVRTLRGLNHKQRLGLKGKLREKMQYWARQYGCGIEEELAHLAYKAFEREDYTMGLIYRYINEKDVFDLLKI